MVYGRFFGIVVGVGMMGAIIFGIWLAIDVDGYELWDGWILASFVLWAIAGWGRARQGGSRPTRSPGAPRASATRRSTASGCCSSSSSIWKPGA